MNWQEIKDNATPRVLRQFAAACLLLIGGWGLTLLLRNPHSDVGAFLLGFGAALGGAGLAYPPCLRLVYLTAAALTFPIGWAVSRFLMAVIYFGLLAPIRLTFVLLGRDRLRLRRAPASFSYWRPRPAAPPVESYFRQF